MNDPVVIPLTSFLEDLPSAAEVKAHALEVQRENLQDQANALIETILIARDNGETSVVVEDCLPDALVAELEMKGYKVELPPAIYDYAVNQVTSTVRWDEVEVPRTGPQDVVRGVPQEEGAEASSAALLDDTRYDPLWGVLQEQKEWEEGTPSAKG